MNIFKTSAVAPDQSLVTPPGLERINEDLREGKIDTALQAIPIDKGNEEEVALGFVRTLVSHEHFDKVPTFLKEWDKVSTIVEGQLKLFDAISDYNDRKDRIIPDEIRALENLNDPKIYANSFANYHLTPQLASDKKYAKYKDIMYFSSHSYFQSLLQSVSGRPHVEDLRSKMRVAYDTFVTAFRQGDLACESYPAIHQHLFSEALGNPALDKAKARYHQTMIQQVKNLSPGQTLFQIGQWEIQEGEMHANAFVFTRDQENPEQFTLTFVDTFGYLSQVYDSDPTLPKHTEEKKNKDGREYSNPFLTLGPVTLNQLENSDFFQDIFLMMHSKIVFKENPDYLLRLVNKLGFETVEKAVIKRAHRHCLRQNNVPGCTLKLLSLLMKYQMLQQKDHEDKKIAFILKARDLINHKALKTSKKKLIEKAEKKFETRYQKLEALIGKEEVHRLLNENEWKKLRHKKFLSFM